MSFKVFSYTDESGQTFQRVIRDADAEQAFLAEAAEKEWRVSGGEPAAHSKETDSVLGHISPKWRDN